MAEGLLYRRRIWTQQPPKWTGLDKLHPLYPYMRGVSCADTMRDALTGGALTASGATTPRGSRAGVGVDHTTSSLALHRTVPAVSAQTVWVAGVMVADVDAGTRKWALALRSTTGTGTALAISQGNLGNGRATFAVRRVDGGTLLELETAGMDMPIGEPFVVFAISRSRTNHSVYIRRTRYDFSTDAGTDANFAATVFALGASYQTSATLGFDGVVPMGLYGLGDPGDGIIFDWLKNPWKVFAPANSPIFYSLPGGGTSYNDSLTDTADASDSASTALAALGTISDSGALTDTASSTLAAIDALADSGALTDSATSARVAVDALADSAAVTDATSTVLSAVGALTDSAVASETISGALVMTEALADSAAAADSATGTVGAQSYTDLLTDNAASTDAFTASVSSGELASGGWDFFLRPIRHRDPPETLPEARKAVKTVARKAKKLRERADELAAEAAHLAWQSERRERTEATIAELRSQVQQYEQIATQLRIHVELLIERQREDDDLEILLLAA